MTMRRALAILIFASAAAGHVLALVAVLWPMPGRPSLLVADAGPVRLARALWRAPLILGPPRIALHA